MRVDVIELMRNGQPLSRNELYDAPRLAGNLFIAPWVDGSVFNRPVLRARLQGLGHGDPPDLVAPIFDPAILHVSNDRMRLRGVQLVSAEGQTRHVVQEWMVRPATLANDI